MKHGQVWEVVLEPPVSTRTVQSWDEAWRAPLTPRGRFVLITAPDKGWPWNARWAGWWRSRLLVGDPGKRSQEAILTNFYALLRQTPPIRRNWRRDLAKGYVDRIQWHLIWVTPLTVL
jgi:hypothetical protein